MSVDHNVHPEHPAGKEALHLLYHELRPERSAYTYALELRAFEQHLTLFADRRSSGVPGLLPRITFDDGHISNFEYALPALHKYQFPAHFFITAGWTGSRAGYMGWPELRSLHAAGHAIGAHGWSHKLLTHCTPDELIHELHDARQHLEQGLGAPVTTMSLPGGRANPRVLAACQAAGYGHIYTSAPRPETLPVGPTVGRLNLLGTATPNFLARLLAPGSSTLASIRRTHKIKQAAQTLLGDQIYARLWSLLNRQQHEEVEARP